MAGGYSYHLKKGMIEIKTKPTYKFLKLYRLASIIKYYNNLGLAEPFPKR